MTLNFKRLIQMRVLFLIVLSFILASCGEEKVKSPSKALDKNVSEIISDIKNLKDLSNQGLILQSVTPIEYVELNQILLKTEAVAKRLSYEPNDPVALNALLTFYQQIKDFPFTDIDRTYFQNLSKKMERALISYAEQQGVIIWDLNRYQKVYTENFEKGLEDWSQITEEGNTRLRFMARNFGKDFYARISSFVNNGENLAGTQRLISPKILLNTKGQSEVQISHAFRHYPNENHELKLLTFYVRAEGEEWQEIILPKLPAGTSYDAEESGFIKLSKELQGKTVEFSFLYKATLEINPLWDIHRLEIRVDNGK